MYNALSYFSSWIWKFSAIFQSKFNDWDVGKLPRRRVGKILGDRRKLDKCLSSWLKWFCSHNLVHCTVNCTAHYRLYNMGHIYISGTREALCVISKLNCEEHQVFLPEGDSHHWRDHHHSPQLLPTHIHCQGSNQRRKD